MTKLLINLVAVAIFMAGAMTVTAGVPEDETTMVIALSTDDFDLPETDISHLAIGDAETIHTESGKTIDLLRTEEGVEIYVDGELLKPGLGDLHDGHAVIRHDVEVICESEGECEETVWVTDEDGIDPEAHHAGAHHEKIIVIEKEIETQ